MFLLQLDNHITCGFIDTCEHLFFLLVNIILLTYKETKLHIHNVYHSTYSLKDPYYIIDKEVVKSIKKNATERKTYNSKKEHTPYNKPQAKASTMAGF